MSAEEQNAGEMREKTDEELVRLTLEDRDCFLYLMRRYQAPLARYIVRLAGLTREDTEDVLQESFIKIYRNLKGFDTSLKFSSWAYRITHNETMDHLRRRRSRPRIIETADQDELLRRIAADTDLETAADRDLMIRILRQSLARLSPKYREVLVLRYLEERDYREISDILRLPEGTVATRLNRAKIRLRGEYVKSSEKGGDL